MTLSFKSCRFLPSPARTPAGRTLALVAVVACLASAGGSVLPTEAWAASVRATLPTASTDRARAAATRGALPVRTDSSRARRAASIAVRSLRFRSNLTHRAPLGDFSQVTLAPAGPATSTTDTVNSVAVAPAAPIAPVNDESFVVMIDPGHGGSDPGAIAYNGLQEKELTRDIGERVRLFLSEVDGVTVLMTREGDQGLSRHQRVRRVRDSEADLVLSLHFNHLPQQEITLVESFYAGAENIAESQAVQAGAARPAARTADIDLSFTRGSERLAGLVQSRVYGEVARDNSAALDAGVKRDTLFVLTRSFVPGALVELTCLSNPAEADRLVDEDYRNALAAALADAVRDYRRSLQQHPLADLGA